LFWNCAFSATGRLGPHAAASRRDGWTEFGGFVVFQRLKKIFDIVAGSGSTRLGGGLVFDDVGGAFLAFRSG